MADLRSHRLAQNLEALRPWDPRMADRIAAAPRDPEICAQTARDGTVSIAASCNGSERIQIHSRYRPTEEARRAVAALPAAATCIVHGLGGAFIPRAYLAKYRESCVVVTERAASTVRTVFEEIDLVTELRSGRLRVATTREELATTLESVHIPAVRDGIHATELTSWVSRKPHRDHFLALHDAITATLHSIAAEMATMRHFGRPWLSHTVENSLRVRWESVPSGIEQFRCKTRGAATRVLAAGPSLDDWFLEHPLSDADVPEIAVDTAVPAVAARGRRVFAIMSLDPQGWSPLHFRRPVPAAYLCGDMGISPGVTARTEQFLPVASGHPLHQLLQDHGFPMLPATRSTNVTEAAVAVLRAVGSSSIDLVGADFGYPRAKTYARGTYHYGLAMRRSDRLLPQESFFARRVYPESVIAPHDSDGRSLEHTRDASHPFFRRPGMEAAASSLRNVLAHSQPASWRPTGIAQLDSGSVPPAPVPFWTHHIEELGDISRRIERIGPSSTPEILEYLGPHGRSHLPVLPALELLAGRRQTVGSDPTKRISAGLTDVRAFIFSHLRRYSN